MTEPPFDQPFTVSAMIPSPHGPMPAYVAAPDGAGPHPAVVVIHDVFGATPDLRAQADWLASAGFLAVAPNLFHHQGRVTCIRRAFTDLRQRQGRTFDDVEAARAWVAARAQCSGQVGVIGFCMGGGFALLMAPLGRYQVASINYGQVPADAETILMGSCPLVASYGGRDRTLSGAADRLESALTRLAIDHDVREYPAAGHGFMNRHRGLLPTVMAKVGGVAYEPDAAADARSRIIAFFERHLGLRPQPD